MSKKKRPPIPRFEHPIIETHCHLDYLEEDQLATTLDLSSEVGIERIITIAVSADNLARVRQLANSDARIWGTQGIHPHEAENFNEEVEREIREHLPGDRILAVGEIGLDYFYDHAEKHHRAWLLYRETNRVKHSYVQHSEKYSCPQRLHQLEED